MSFVRTTTRHSRPSGAAATRKEMLTCQVSFMRTLRLVRPTQVIFVTPVRFAKGLSLLN